MNKIYRRLWSTALQCWVVASELAAPRGKAASTVLKSIAFCLLLIPGVLTAQELESEAEGEEELNVLLSDGSLPHAMQLMAQSNRNVGLYAGTFTGPDSVQLGPGAYAAGSDNAAVGPGARTSGLSSSAFGHGAVATNQFSTAIGGRSNASGGFGLAVGYNANASGMGSIALGYDSVASEDYSVSVGSSSRKRKIVNVDDGALNSNSFEVVNGRQLQRVVDSVNGITDSVTNVSRVANSAQNIATTALNNTKLVQVVGGLIHVGREQGGNVLTVSNKDGGKRYVNGVQNATLSASSSDAVTGQQLFATNQKVDATNRTLATGNAITAANTASAKGNLALAMGQAAKADGVAALSLGHSAVAVGGNTIALGSAAGASGAFAVALGGNAKATHANSVALGEKSVTTGEKQVSVGSAAFKRKIVNLDDGLISAGSSEAVTGNQLFNEKERVNGLVKQASAGGIMYIGAENTGNVLTVSNKDGGKRYVNGVQNATLSASSSDAVTGQQLFATNNTLGTVQATANQAKATADLGLSKADWLGRLISGGPTGGVQIGAENAGSLLSVRNQTGGRRVITGLHNADLSTASTEAVTGQQLFATNNNVAAAQLAADTALGKANTLDGLVSQATPTGNVRLGGENTGAVLDVRNKSGAGRSLTGLADGEISATSTEAVTGKQLQATHDRLATAQSRADAAHTSAAAAQATADQAKAKADATGNAVATAGAIDFDKRATASGNLAMAMGQAAKANGTAAFAMGHSAIAAGDNAVSLGSASSASARAAVALGGNAKAKHENSVALGERSETGGTNEVSVGNAATGLKRRVVNVDDARLTDSSTDAVTGKQLFATNEKVQANEGLLAAHGTDLSAQSGRIADNRRDLDALRSEFEDFDPDLDGVVKFAADGSVDIAGGKVRGVAAGDISSATSTDAVNGGQLFATNERLSSVERGSAF